MSATVSRVKIEKLSMNRGRALVSCYVDQEGVERGTSFRDRFRAQVLVSRYDHRWLITSVEFQEDKPQVQESLLYT